MKAKICVIYDSKAEGYMQPFFSQASGAAIRAFSDELNNPQSQNRSLHDHPEDYTLFEIGTWDDKEGRIEPYTAPQALIRGVDVTERQVLKASK